MRKLLETVEKRPWSSRDRFFSRCFLSGHTRRDGLSQREIVTLSLAIVGFELSQNLVGSTLGSLLQTILLIRHLKGARAAQSRHFELF